MLILDLVLGKYFSGGCVTVRLDRLEKQVSEKAAGRRKNNPVGRDHLQIFFGSNCLTPAHFVHFYGWPTCPSSQTRVTSEKFTEVRKSLYVDLNNGKNIG